MSSYESIIYEATELAYELDTYMVVGRDQCGGWVIRGWEDPEAGLLSDSVKVRSDGICEEYEDQHEMNKQNAILSAS